MERRLLRAIINPAMIAAWLLGLGLACEADGSHSHWLQAKFVLVLILSGIHGLLARWVRTSPPTGTGIARILSGSSMRYRRC